MQKKVSAKRSRRGATSWLSWLWQKTRPMLRQTLLWGDRLPRGVRSLVGVLVTAAGFIGFLPVLGFWMIPAGLALIALDVPPWRRWMHEKLDLSPPSRRKAA